MEHEPFDNDLFDPPPKQHKQQSSLGSQPAYAKQQQQQQQRTQQATSTTTTAATTITTTTATTSYISITKNATGHTNMPSSISGCEVRHTTASPYTDYQYSPKSLPISHIVQSGSYVEILKQGMPTTAINAFTPVQRTADISPTHQNQKRHHRSITACHNKSYGDFLTITPRRRGNKLMVSTGYDNENSPENLVDAYQHDNYHHEHHRRANLPHSIEPLHLLGISDEKNYTFLDYRAMEAISNADTLEMGSSITGAGGGHNKMKYKERYNNHSSNNDKMTTTTTSISSTTITTTTNKNQHIAEVSSDYQYFMREKNLSPPTAFSDNISAINKKNSNI